MRDEVDSSAVRPHHGLSDDLRRNNFNMKTVAILPMSNDVPIDAFARKLHAALEGVGARTSYLNQASVMSHLGRHAFTRMGQLKVASWLTDQELRYRMVMYVADAPVSAPWTQTCIRMVCSTHIWREPLLTKSYTRPTLSSLSASATSSHPWVNLNACCSRPRLRRGRNSFFFMRRVT